MGFKKIFDIPKVAKPRPYSLAKAILFQYNQKLKQEATRLELPPWLEPMRHTKVYDALKGFIPLTDHPDFREAVKKYLPPSKSS